MLLTLVLCCASLTTDWPQFRGSHSDSHVEGTSIPETWSDTEHVVWKIELSGLGWSSPSIVGNRAYLTTAVSSESGLSLRAMAIDTTTGEMIWDREVRSLPETPAIHTKNSHASPTPIVADGSVYVHFGALGMARLSAETGEVLWLNTELVYTPLHGSGGSPVLHDGKLVVVCDGSSDPFVAAVDAESGELLWKQPRSVAARISHSFVTPLVTVVDGQAQVLAPGPDHFAAYDLASGKELWKVLAPGWSVVPQPTVGHGMVYYNHDYDAPELMAVRLGGSGDVTDSHVAWRIKRGAPSTPTPLLIDEELYFVSDDGIVSCVNALTGETHWLERIGGNFSASPAFVNGKILLLDEDGRAIWIRRGTTFEKLGENEVPGRTLASPAFADDAMYLRTDTSLYKIAK